MNKRFLSRRTCALRDVLHLSSTRAASGGRSAITVSEETLIDPEFAITIISEWQLGEPGRHSPFTFNNSPGNCHKLHPPVRAPTRITPCRYHAVRDPRCAQLCSPQPQVTASRAAPQQRSRSQACSDGVLQCIRTSVVVASVCDDRYDCRYDSRSPHG